MTILKPQNPNIDVINKSTLVISKPLKKEEHGSLNEEALETENPDEKVYRIFDEQANNRDRRLSNTMKNPNLSHEKSPVAKPIHPRSNTAF